MAKRGTWADHVVVINMAKMLQRDIMIVTSSPSSSGNDCLLWVPGDRSGKNEQLLLGHMWENHYQSLQPIKLTVSPLLAEKQNGHSKDSPQVKNQDCDGHSEDWLREKIGSYFSIPFPVGLNIVCKYVGSIEKNIIILNRNLMVNKHVGRNPVDINRSMSLVVRKQTGLRGF